MNISSLYKLSQAIFGEIFVSGKKIRLVICDYLNTTRANWKNHANLLLIHTHPSLKFYPH